MSSRQRLAQRTTRMNPLRALTFKAEYRSGQDDLITELYRPALARAGRYWRAVGYFSSSALEVIGQPLGDFVYKGGVVRLVTSVDLQADDYEAIERGVDKLAVCDRRLLQQIRDGFADPAGRGAQLLAMLLEAGRMEVKIAVPDATRGIYHEKVGIFIDDCDGRDDYVAFAGSSNESRTAFESNYECVDVYTSWSETARAIFKRRHFEALWSGHAVGVETLPFPDAARKELIKIVGASSSGAPTLAANSAAGGAAKTPIDPWRHQDEAVSAFLQMRRGILEMATGTGKTRTALRIVERLTSNRQIDSVIVASEGTDLLDQWARQLHVTAGAAEPRYRVLRHYDMHHEMDEYRLDSSRSILVASRSALRRLLPRLNAIQKRKLILIHDEVHGLGSPTNVQALDGFSEDVPFVLGLSATPEREYDLDGTAFIERNVGSVIYRFTLEQAIRRGILCAFDYVPIEYQPSDEDRQRVHNILRRRAARAASGEPMPEAEVWRELARVHKTSLVKIPLFAEHLALHPEVVDRSIMFVEQQDYGDQVLEILHRHTHEYHTYYAEDDRRNLEQFARGRINCLVTCHRVSEGIDIRSINSVVLFASDRARLETIQRIGRCLRVDPSNPDKRATVIDFVREQENAEADLNTDQERRAWIEELSRAGREEPADAA